MPPTPFSPADPGAAAGGADSLWVVLPVYNESAAIERVVAEWLPVLVAADPRVVLLVIDDGSTDNTPDVLAQLARSEPRLRVVRQENRGHGAACRRGYELAVAPGSGAGFVLQIDSDGQCDPADFAAFWRERHRHPLQLGRRRRRADGSLRAAASRALAVLVSLASGSLVRDVNVPYRLVRRDVLAAALETVPAGSVELENAALAVAGVELVAPRWVDIGFRQRHAGRSHYRFKRMAALAAGLLRWLWLRAPRAPVSPARSAAAVAAAAVAWTLLAAAVAVFAWRNLDQGGLWYDEAVQVHTSLGIHPMATPWAPAGTLRDVVVRNAADQLDPGGYGVLLHFWMRAFGTGVRALHSLSGLLSLAGLAALAALAWRWLRHPLAPPAAVALALVDPLVREHVLEVRPYALELGGVWAACWALDRLLARPDALRALVFGLVLVALLGSRYSAFLTAAALCGALALEALPRGVLGGWRRRALLAVAAVPPLLAVAVIARWSLPGLRRRATANAGRLVEYLDPQTLAGLTAVEAVGAALRHLAHPAVFALTVAAALGLGSLLRRVGRGVTSPSSRVLRRAALLLLVMTIVLWPWHPWDPRVKWSFYLRLVATVCALRLVADLQPRLFAHRLGRLVGAATAVALVLVAAALTGTHDRWRWDTALPALERVGTLLASGHHPAAPGAVAVDVHPTPGVRYYYEHGPLRGRPEYPDAFRFPVEGELAPATLCQASWLLSFDSLRSLERRYPELRFAEDAAASQLLWVSPREDAPAACGGSAADAIGRGVDGGER